MEPSLFLIDDGPSQSFHPFCLSRPVGELLFGTFLLRERAERFWGVDCAGHLSRNTLRGFSETGTPPVLDPSGVDPTPPKILQSGRVALWGDPPAPAQDTATLFLGDQVVGWMLPPQTPLPNSDLLAHPEPLPGSVRIQVEGRLLKAPWELMQQNGDQLRADIPRFFPGYAAEEIPGCHLLGTGLLSLGSDVTVEPGSVFDLTEGPIRLSDGVTVRAHTRLSGPAYVGPESTLLGGVFSEISVGPVCKVRGEVECSVILGFTNKAHDGFLGHAYLGKWVNLGAFTTNSDLKNNYGPVRVGGTKGTVDTGLMKVGCFLGDHVKTGIGTVLNTGTVVGLGSNLFGGAMPPTYVPPFSWGTGKELVEYRLDKFLEVARTAMERRNVALDEKTEELLAMAWEASRAERSPGG